MPLYDEFVDARWVAPENSRIIQLSRSVNHLVGVTPLVLARPAGVRVLTIRCESGTIRIRPDRYAGWIFTGGNILTGTDIIDVQASEGDHGYTTGDGPFQITVREAQMILGTSVVIDEVANTFTRTVGSWWTDGFWTGAQFTVAESASNNGTFTIDTQTVTVITVDEDIIVGEGAQTDLVITGLGASLVDTLSTLTNYWAIVVDDNSIRVATSLANALANVFIDILGAGANGGRFNWGGPAGWGANAVAAATVSDGYGSLAVTAGNEVSFAAPERITLVGMSASDACSYWWGE